MHLPHPHLHHDNLMPTPIDVQAQLHMCLKHPYPNAKYRANLNAMKLTKHACTDCALTPIQQRAHGTRTHTPHEQEPNKNIYLLKTFMHLNVCTCLCMHTQDTNAQKMAQTQY